MVLTAAPSHVVGELLIGVRLAIELELVAALARPEVPAVALGVETAPVGVLRLLRAGESYLVAVSDAEVPKWTTFRMPPLPPFLLVPLVTPAAGTRIEGGRGTAVAAVCGVAAAVVEPVVVVVVVEVDTYDDMGAELAGAEVTSLGAESARPALAFMPMRSMSPSMAGASRCLVMRSAGFCVPRTFSSTTRRCLTASWIHRD